MKFNSVLLIVLMGLVTGCLGPKMVKHTTVMATPESEVIVIGQFELWPPVATELEQSTHWNVVGDERILNTLFMATGAANQAAPPSMSGPGWQATIETQWGQPFMVELKRQRTWLNGGMMQLDALHKDRLWFPGGLYFDIPDGATAVYIGTLRYSRNDFNTIVDMRVTDDYHKTLKALGISDAEVVSKSLLKTEQDSAPEDLLAYSTTRKAE